MLTMPTGSLSCGASRKPKGLPLSTDTVQTGLRAEPAHPEIAPVDEQKLVVRVSEDVLNAGWETFERLKTNSS